MLPNVNLNACVSEIFPPHFGDHCAFQLDFFFFDVQGESRWACFYERFAWDISDENLLKLIDDISENSFAEIYTGIKNANLICEASVKIVKSSITFCCPLIRLTNKQNS